MKKLIIALMVLSISLSGCASIKAFLQKGCDNPEQVAKYKAAISGALASAQVGYSVIAALAGTNTNPAVAVNIAAIDNVLGVIGSLYYDKVCPTYADVETAREYAEIAAEARQELGITE